MKLNEALIKKLNWISNEIKNLKTAHFKTATSIATKEMETNIAMSLKLTGTPSDYYREIVSTKRAIITLTTTDNSNMISAVYLKGVNPTNLNDRYLFVKRVAGASGKSIYSLWIYSLNQNDRATLEGGGSINLNYTLQAVGSSDYTISVSYKDLT